MIQLNKGFQWLAGVFLLLGAISMVRTTVAQGTDFDVFWRAARYTLQGQPLYSIVRDGGMIFKYPPWTLPFFIPLGMLPLEVSKWIWGAIEVASLVYVGHWLKAKMNVRSIVLYSTLVSFWGLWIVHALDGQVTLPLLALALACGPTQYPVRNSLRFFPLALGLSTKIFTVFPLLGWKGHGRVVAPAIGLFVLLICLSIPAAMNQPSASFSSLARDWVAAATSSSTLLSAEQVRGRTNPGLPGYTLSLLGVPASQSSADVGLALFYGVLLGGLWRAISRRFEVQSQWLGWLALTPVVHPLPWWHLFVFTFPLATVALDRSLQTKKMGLILTALIGIFLIGVSTEKVWGPFGLFLEMNAAKSWGALICLGVFLQVERSRLSPLVGA